MALLVQILGTLACLAGLGAIVVLAQRLKGLEEKVDRAARKEGPTVTRSRPMLSGLQRESAASPLAVLTELPGGWWVTAAAALAIGGMVTGRISPVPSRAKPQAAPVDSTVVQLRSQVDTLALQLRTLRDSVHQASVARAPVAGRPRAVMPVKVAATKGEVLPNAPALPTP